MEGLARDGEGWGQLEARVVLVVQAAGVSRTPVREGATLAVVVVLACQRLLEAEVGAVGRVLWRRAVTLGEDSA